MPHRQNKSTMPASREPASLLAVDRAVAELRRGRMVAIRAGHGEAALVQAAEAASPDSLALFSARTQHQPDLVITARRAAVLGLSDASSKIVSLHNPEPWHAEHVLAIADPLADALAGAQGSDSAPIAPDARKDAFEISNAAPHGPASAAVGLAKIARLLPAALVAPLDGDDADDLGKWSARHDLLMVDAGDIFQHVHTSARALRPVSQANVPLLDANNTKIIAFRPADGGIEHLAIIVGEPNVSQPVLVRLHSECFTGDLLGSLRCDCGDQLRGAIQEINACGSGVLLYLAQEGRGIGLVNKLRAYELQDRGFDTIDANEQLGFDADERIYLPAAQMLRQLDITRVRLLTNNPVKVTALGACDIEVTERVPHAFPANPHNELYLKTKAARGGHLF